MRATREGHVQVDSRQSRPVDNELERPRLLGLVHLLRDASRHLSRSQQSCVSSVGPPSARLAIDHRSSAVLDVAFAEAGLLEEVVRVVRVGRVEEGELGVCLLSLSDLGLELSRVGRLVERASGPVDEGWIRRHAYAKGGRKAREGQARGWRGGGTSAFVTA